MKEKINKIVSSKNFHVYVVTVIILFIIFVALVISLKYTVEGEKDLPFDLFKISVISSTEGQNVQDEEHKWNLSVSQNNDIYLYIKKNDNYKDTEVIKSIEVENIKATRTGEKGIEKIYKPDGSLQNSFFSATSENEVDKVEYIGDLSSDIKNLKISNQGGLVVFRYALNELGNYISDDDVEINHNDLLKKIDIKNEDIQLKLSFDLIINLDSDKSYKSTVELDLPVGNVIDEGVQSMEYTDLSNIVFKRL